VFFVGNVKDLASFLLRLELHVALSIFWVFYQLYENGFSGRRRSERQKGNYTHGTVIIGGLYPHYL